MLADLKKEDGVSTIRTIRIFEKDDFSCDEISVAFGWSMIIAFLGNNIKCYNQICENLSYDVVGTKWVFSKYDEMPKWIASSHDESPLQHGFNVF